MAKRIDVVELRAAIRGADLRATPSRIAVLALVRQCDQPISHGDVADKLADQAWDRATIYRNLIDLADAGLLRRSDLGDHVWRFEAVDGAHDGGDPHPHFVCTECGIVECLPEAQLAIPRRAPRAMKQRQIEIHVRGLCDVCL